MDRKEVFEKLRDFLAEVTVRDPEDITEDTDLTSGELGLDDMDYLEITIFLQEEFDLTEEDTDDFVCGAGTVSDAVQYILDRLK